MLSAQSERDRIYVEKFLTPIRVCATYKPAFGGGRGFEEETNLSGFKALYGSDPLYHWLGLDSNLMYAAHKAAGGMTSIYRQVGIGCERLFRSILMDELNLSDEQVAWGDDSEAQPGKVQRLTLDARVDVSHLARDKSRDVSDWLLRCGDFMNLPGARSTKLVGAVFEVRQGYKSADAKRQNADLRFGLNSYVEDYLPVIAVISNQVSQTVVSRYRSANLLVLTGTIGGPDTESTFSFFENVVGYSLKLFFERNASILKSETEKILTALLSPS